MDMLLHANYVFIAYAPCLASVRLRRYARLLSLVKTDPEQHCNLYLHTLPIFVIVVH